MSTISRISEKKNFFSKGLFWLFLLTPFVKPSYFGQIPSLDTVYNIWRVLSFAIIIWIYVTKQSISKVAFTIVVLVSINIISTIIQGGELYKAFSYAVLSVGSFTTIDLLIRKNVGLVFRVVLPIFEALIYINLFTIIKYPDGLYTLIQASGWKSDLSWFLGLRNGMIQWVLIAIYLGILNMYCGRKTIRKKVRTGLLLTACTVTCVLVNVITKSYNKMDTSAGGLATGWVLFMIYFLIPSRIKVSGIISFANMVWLNIAFFLTIVVFRMQNVFSWFIEGVLGKNMTFTGRTIIWDNALNLILKYPLLGLGFEEEVTKASKLGSTAAVFTTHNSFIDILYHGGFLALLIFLLVLMMIHKDVKWYYRNKISTLIAYTVGVYFITAQFEGFTGVCMFILLAFASNTPLVITYYQLDVFGKSNLAEYKDR